MFSPDLGSQSREEKKTIKTAIILFNECFKIQLSETSPNRIFVKQKGRSDLNLVKGELPAEEVP